MKLSRLIEYLLVTSWFWVCYATLLPIYFHFVFNWGWNQTVVWWLTGTPVEFFLAYPIGKGLIKLHPWIRKIARLPESNDQILLRKLRELEPHNLLYFLLVFINNKENREKYPNIIREANDLLKKIQEIEQILEESK